MKLYCCQFDIAWEDPAKNFAKVEALLEKANPESGGLVQVPEMFSTGFSMNVAGIQEGPTGQAARFLSGLARRYEVFVLGGMVSAAPGNPGKGLNQAVAFSPQGEELTRYDKIHPFSLGKENDHYAAGQRVVQFQWQDLPVAPFVCYDLRFPEIFRLGAKRGAKVMTVMANWPEKRVHHWRTLLQARAIENQAYVAGVNRCGKSPDHIYNGQSMIIGPNGEVLADAGDGESVIAAEISGEALSELRAKLPFLKDTRLDYSELP